MPSPLFSFNSYAKDIYSQDGADGIIDEILRRINSPENIERKWCVEFGAWDGIYLSNTYNLIKNHGYSAVLIEANTQKYLELCKNIPQDDAIKINKFVTFEGSNTLDKLLSETGMPKDFDFLSIDIDGNDYHVLDSIESLRPKLICIEFNPCIPNEVEFIQVKDFNVKHGSSAKSIWQLARRKGYALVATTDVNLFFIDRCYLEKIGIEQELTLDELRDDSRFKVYIFSGYDGTVFTSKPFTVWWHGLTIADKSLQQLPLSLRRFPSDYNPIQKILFRFFSFFKNPQSYLEKRAERVRKRQLLK